MKNLILSALIAVFSILASSEHATLAAAPCAPGQSKKVVKIAGTSGGFPATCKINTCRDEGLVRTISHTEFPIGIVLDAAYRVDDGYVATQCPASVHAVF